MADDPPGLNTDIQDLEAKEPSFPLSEAQMGPRGTLQHFAGSVKYIKASQVALVVKNPP